MWKISAITAMCAIPAVVFCQTATLSVSPPGPVRPAGTISVGITLNASGTEPAGIAWALRYPASLGVAQLLPGPAATRSGKSLNCAPRAGAFECLISGMNASAIADGLIAVATFQVSSDPGNAPAAILLTDVLAVTPSGSGIAAAGTGASLAVEASCPAVARLLSPAPGSALPGAAVTFSWSAAPDADNYWLDVGTESGSGDLSAGSTTATSKAVTGLPRDGSQIQARLWTHAAGAWQPPVYYSFTAAADSRARLVSPAPGTALLGTTVAFAWNSASGADGYWLDAGSEAGQGDYFAAPVAADNATVTGLPCDGRTIHAQLWTHWPAGGWQTPERYTFTAATGCAALAAPPGPSLDNAAGVFRWEAVPGADRYWLDLGSGIGIGDLFASPTDGASLAASGLPCDGRPVYAQLWTHTVAGWKPPGRYRYWSWAACGGISSPPPGTVLAGAAVTFAWTAGAGVSAYWLDVGTSPGQGDIFGANVGTRRSQAVGGIPLDGSPVYLQLWSQIAGIWYPNRYVYRGGGL
jgi:hypothetical protein